EHRCRFVEEPIDHGPIGGICRRLLGSDGIQQRQFERAGLHVRGRSSTGVAEVACLCKVSYDIGFLQRSYGLECQQFGIPGADADTDQQSLAHEPGLASALTAAAAIALPPILPRTTRNGMPREWVNNSSLDSAAPTNPTGKPRIAAGRGAPPSISSSRRKRAVGALPIATTEPPSLSVQRSSAAAERVVPKRSANAGTLGSCR